MKFGALLMPSHPPERSISGMRCFARALLLVMPALTFALPALAQENEAVTAASVEVVAGTLQEGDFVAYQARDLKRGDRLEVHGAGTSGTLAAESRRQQVATSRAPGKGFSMNWSNPYSSMARAS